MERFKEIVKFCNADVHLTVNNHKSSYRTVTEEFEIAKMLDETFTIEKDIGQEIFDKMVELDTIYELQFYPDTPVGCYVIYHYDLDMLLDKSLETLRKKI